MSCGCNVIKKHSQQLVVSLDKEHTFDGHGCVSVDDEGRVLEVGNKERQDGEQLIFRELGAEGVHKLDGVGLHNRMHIGSLGLEIGQNMLAKEAHDVHQSVRACHTMLCGITRLVVGWQQDERFDRTC